MTTDHSKPQIPSENPPHYEESLAPTPSIYSTNEAAPTEKPTKPKAGFGANFHKITTMAGLPLNKAANLVGAEGWWPSTMDKESDKAARILYSFTKMGAAPPKKSGPMHPTGITKKSMITIPQQVLNNCAGLAIFNVIRAGAWMGSLAAGSGVVVARRPDGTWSPPSAFVVSTVGAGLMLGLDIYDCVIVLNTPAQLAAFTHPRVSLGGEMSIALGPVGTGGAVEAAASKTVRPMYSYMKSRGLWAGIQVDGTIIVARPDANHVFYGDKKMSAKRILQGDTAWPAGAKNLHQVLMALEGKTVLDPAIVREVTAIPTPGDAPAYVDTRDADDETLLDEKERLRRAGY